MGVWYFPVNLFRWHVTTFVKIQGKRIFFYCKSCPLILIGHKKDQLLLQVYMLKSKGFIGHFRQSWSEVWQEYYAHVHLLSQTGVAFTPHEY